ncbi:MAG: cell division protein SepF [Nanoarchaeota archaeon]|nr:cell division protein SepF [Nanoarchaeota archaeon]MBU1135554.1 cell division protein SepF [Nanoarchaeota archaeon]MBU2520381.1 cell division protein SepF [Nanoarchaeota archaeon]
MVFEKLRGMAREENYENDNGDYVEVGVTDTLATPSRMMRDVSLGKIGIKIDKLTDFGDTERILRNVRDGKLIFLKIKTLREKDMGELKRAVERLRKTVIAGNGDIAGVEQDWLILTPEAMVIHRD